MTKNKQNYKKHGLTNTRLYNVWQNIKRRCYTKTNPSYKYYGRIGIKMCDEWHYNFQSFYDWAYANGYDDSLEFGKCTLDRIDNNGNYEPSNCRWVDNKTQQRNRRDRERVIYNGEEITLAEVSERTGISISTLWERKQRGVLLDSDTKRNKFVLRSDGVVFKSIEEAAKNSNTTHSSVSKVCNGIRKSAKGYGFVFLTKSEAEARLKELQENKK